MTITRTFVLSTVAALAMAGAALSATVTVSQQNQKNVFADATGKNAWYQTTSYSLNGIGRTALAGLFRLTETTAGGSVTKFVGVCLEPLEWLRLPKAYDESTPLGASVVGQLGALLTNALSLVTDAKSAAAFQIAAWEIANEGGGKLDLGNGAFKVSAAGHGTKALAQTWLDLIAKGTWKKNNQVMILQAPGTQDLLTDLPAEVPVPAAGVLLVGALGGLAAVRRRRTV
jgi:hypothetical protein